jgi:vancomycin permeability regulator SanA
VTLSGLAAALSGATAANARVTGAADGLAYDDAAAVPTRTVAIVFGTLVEPDGSPSDRLADRLRGAVDLYRAGRVGHLLMTGDNRRPDYDEVSAMRAWALDAGVPAAAITRDYAGLDTYDSCVRARDVFGVHDAVLVTQAYHLPRALYLCRRQGIDAVGLAVPDWEHRAERAQADYPLHKQVNHTVREWFARANAIVDAQVLRRGPAIPGPYEGLRPT